MEVNNGYFKNPEYNTPENVKTINLTSRHQMIKKLLADIQLDMVICQLEGWDPMEYIRELQGILNSFTPDNINTEYFNSLDGRQISK